MVSVYYLSRSLVSTLGASQLSLWGTDELARAVENCALALEAPSSLPRASARRAVLSHTLQLYLIVKSIIAVSIRAVSLMVALSY